jgi:ribose transport system substrate-binding protein
MKSTSKAGVLKRQTAKLVAPSKTTRSDYTITSVERACEVLKCFDAARGSLQLDEITKRTGLPRPTAFRLLHTLVTCGMLDRLEKNVYGLSAARKAKKGYRFGYAGESEQFSFSRLVSGSIHRCAYEAGIELVLLDNEYSATKALRNAKRFVNEKVDLVIEFQAHMGVAPQIASILSSAGIPLIAIDIPHPGAYFYGANNYRAGWIAGQHLAQNCTNTWGGKFDELLLLGLPMAGQIPQTRMTGMLAGLRESLPKFSDRQVVSVNGYGEYERALEAVRKYLRNSKARRVLIGGINDPSTLGALRAFQEAGRADSCLVVGQNAVIEARQEMRRTDSRFIGSVAYFPESYGEAVLNFAFDILRGKEVPPALFVKHRLVTPANVDEFYPNDSLIPADHSDSLLYSSR